MRSGGPAEPFQGAAKGAATDDRPMLAVYVSWHPECPAAHDLARAMFKVLCANPELPATRGLGIPVRFRTSNSSDDAPSRVPFEAAQHTVAFVLADDHLVVNPVWRSYAKTTVEAAGPQDRVIPVALTAPTNLPPPLGGLQAVRLHDVPAEQRETALLNCAMDDLCRVLEPNAPKVSVFLSHAKHDGLKITNLVRQRLHDARLQEFFDATDIPDGTRFAEFIREHAATLSALLAIQTDTYASREWCRLEVLEAKRHRVPIVILSALQGRESRSFPYMGNVPVIRWRDETSLPAVVGALLGEVLRHRYFPLRVQAICRHFALDTDQQVFTNPPELLTLLVHLADTTRERGGVRRYLYPDPPLGTEELEVLHQFDPDIDLVTPTILLTR